MPCESNILSINSKLDILQRNDIEEADSKIILHACQASSDERYKILVMSSDTDVFVLLMYYWIQFEEQSLQVV